MTPQIKSVQLVSDGILVEFNDGMAAFVSANQLAEQRDAGSLPIFLSYDPSPIADTPLFTHISPQVSLPC